MKPGVKEARRERAAQALALRKAGLGWDEVAVRTGYTNRSGAWKSVQTLLAKMEEPAREQRALLLARLDDLLLAVWPAAISGNLDAVDRAVNIIGRQARIGGLERQDVTVIPVVHERPEILTFIQQVCADPVAFSAARRLQKIAEGVIEVQGEVVTADAAEQDEPPHTNGGPQ